MRNRFALPIQYRYVWLIASLAFVVFTTQAYVSHLYRNSDSGFAWFFYLSTNGSHYLLWVLLTPLLFRLSRLHKEREVFSSARLMTHMAIGLVVAAMQSLAASGLRSLCYFLRDGEWIALFDGHGLAAFSVGIFSAFVEYWVIVGTFIAIDYYRRYRQKQLQLVRTENELNNAQLNALKAQLQPHFLFNTLHTISSLMNEDISGAQRMVTRLGHLLRTTLEHQQTHKITLRDELEYVRSYLGIEEVRFQDRLTIRYHVEDDAMDALVPSLILQPLVENAIKHGFARRTDTGSITVSCRNSGDHVIMEVADDGRGAPDIDAARSGSGVGIANVSGRLDQMYGKNASINIESPSTGGFVVRASLPLEFAGVPA